MLIVVVVPVNEVTVLLDIVVDDVAVPDDVDV